MKKSVLLGAVALLFLWCNPGPSLAKEIALNDSFEMQDMTYWTDFGTTPFGVKVFDVVQGNFSWCLWSTPWNNGTAKAYQNLYIMNGVTYVIEADICYHNC